MSSQLDVWYRLRRDHRIPRPALETALRALEKTISRYWGQWLLNAPNWPGKLPLSKLLDELEQPTYKAGWLESGGNLQFEACIARLTEEGYLKRSKVIHTLTAKGATILAQRGYKAPGTQDYDRALYFYYAPLGAGFIDLAERSYRLPLIIHPAKSDIEMHGNFLAQQTLLLYQAGQPGDAKRQQRLREAGYPLPDPQTQCLPYITKDCTLPEVPPQTQWAVIVADNVKLENAAQPRLTLYIVPAASLT